MTQLPRSLTVLIRRDVRALIEPITDPGSPIIANRTLAVIRRMLNFGMRRTGSRGIPRRSSASQGVNGRGIGS
jgi:hypothetical protein